MDIFYCKSCKDTSFLCNILLFKVHASPPPPNICWIWWYLTFKFSVKTSIILSCNMTWLVKNETSWIWFPHLIWIRVVCAVTLWTNPINKKYGPKGQICSKLVYICHVLMEYQIKWQLRRRNPPNGSNTIWKPGNIKRFIPLVLDIIITPL